MKILVTGGTGFIGSNLARHLAGQSHQVFVTGLESKQNFGDLPVSFLGQSFTNLPWDKMGAVDVVFHEAACNDTTLLDKREMFKMNFDWSCQLFEEAKSAGVRKIVYASSTAVYGNTPPPFKESGPFEPLNPYAESKLALDEWATELIKNSPKLTVVGLRYCNIYGPGEGNKGKRATLIYQLAQTMLKGNPSLFKYGEQKRDYLYIKDVVQANLLAAQSKESGIYNCGFGQSVSFNDLVQVLNKVLGLSRKPEYIDNPYADRYQSFTECDMSKTYEKLRFVPEFDIQKGIRDYYENGFLVEKDAI